MILIAWLAAMLTVAGMAQAVAGALAVRRFVSARATAEPRSTWRPAVTILKPLHGDEPMLEQALASFCTLDYDRYQLVFGVQSPLDPAIGVVDTLRARFPDRDIALVVDPTMHGANRKIGNLINMFPQARHDVLVIADSDVHCAPDFLSRIVDTLSYPGTGLSTMLYAGITPGWSLAGALGASWINHGLVPGVLMARALGRQDGLGATMALTRQTLASIGGLRALVEHLADDNELGRLVLAQGLGVRLCSSVAATTIPEVSLGALYRHELRWARTIRAVAPVGYALSAIQFVLVWAMAVLLLSGGATWAAGLFGIAWLVRAWAALGVDRQLASIRPGLATPAQPWLLPLRDLLSMAIMVASYAGDQVEWRGQTLHTGRTGLNASDSDISAPAPTAEQATAI